MGSHSRQPLFPALPKHLRSLRVVIGDPSRTSSPQEKRPRKKTGAKERERRRKQIARGILKQENGREQ